MKIFKRIFLAAATLTFVLFLAANFSIKSSAYKCAGSFSPDKSVGSSGLTLFMKLEEFRWWAYLWAEAGRDGFIWIEVPNEYTYVYLYVNKNGDTFRISESKDDLMSGSFSALSDHLELRFNNGLFRGQCLFLKDKY